MSNEDLTKKFEEDSPQQVNEIENVRSLSNYVIRLQSMEDEIKIDEEKLKKKKEAADLISEQVIPEIMKEMKMKTLKLEDGSGIEIKEIYGASIPLDKRDGEDNKANDYASLAEKNGYQPSQKLKVEPMTLKALYRERVEKGLDLPAEYFNLFQGNKTKITRNK